MGTAHHIFDLTVGARLAVPTTRSPDKLFRAVRFIAQDMKISHRQLGGAGEDLAAAALKKQGYKIMERNYRTPLGEIDLIARHRGALVFIEVKTRRSTRFGPPQEAVSPAKQARLRKLADYYLKQKRLGETQVRFDVVGITMKNEGPEVEIIPAAFDF